ncbi:hypothetical protein DPMN_065940 [Dreissena polymorpha]|uniref:Uncharacterized protein n=1 Tax=Dreissena polymorpha TaxID=45954 RepID=A0A9D3YSJ5_DREPO|nr:hypothetical protein DPMN_065940 [Dreissena polymorpha]
MANYSRKLRNPIPSWVFDLGPLFAKAQKSNIQLGIRPWPNIRESSETQYPTVYSTLVQYSQKLRNPIPSCLFNLGPIIAKAQRPNTQLSNRHWPNTRESSETQYPAVYSTLAQYSQKLRDPIPSCLFDLGPIFAKSQKPNTQAVYSTLAQYSRKLRDQIPSCLFDLGPIFAKAQKSNTQLSIRPWPNICEKSETQYPAAYSTLAQYSQKLRDPIPNCLFDLSPIFA